MPRQSRIDAPDALLKARGIGRKKIFENDVDRDNSIKYNHIKYT